MISILAIDVDRYRDQINRIVNVQKARILKIRIFYRRRGATRAFEWMREPPNIAFRVFKSGYRNAVPSNRVIIVSKWLCDICVRHMYVCLCMRDQSWSIKRRPNVMGSALHLLVWWIYLLKLHGKYRLFFRLLFLGEQYRNIIHAV